jgi:protein-tyrosine phosphatase
MSAAIAAFRAGDAAPSSLTIEGLSNFRDWGGHRTRAGQRIVAGRLYRSAHLATLGPDGADRLAALGVVRIVDLRGATERLGAMGALPDHLIEVRSTPVEPLASEAIRRMLAGGTLDSHHLRDHMIASYRAYVTEAAATFGDAIHAIATAGERAILVHCTAGKDRTGFLVALLQRALGADEDVVIGDYLRTNADWDRASVVGRLPLDDDGIRPILVADPDYLAAAFEEIERHHGDVGSFIRRATRGRVGPDDLAHLIETGS